MPHENFNIEQMDMSILNETKSLLKNRFSSILEMYIEDSQSYIAAINQGLTQKDLQIIAENAHPLKSSSLSLGVIGIGEIAKLIEKIAKESLDENDRLNQIENLLTQLNQGFDAIAIKLKEFLS